LGYLILEFICDLELGAWNFAWPRAVYRMPYAQPIIPQSQDLEIGLMAMYK
jgi:hypothetical protein